MKLYIIGNGFDLAHNLPTSYKDFKAFVEDQNSSMYAFLSGLPEIGDDWSNFEDALANIRFNDFIKLQYLSETNRYDDILEEYSFKLQQLFEDWVNSIGINCRKMFDISSNNSLFLTFNYTNTLERVYSIPTSNIYHIHSKATNLDDVYQKYVFGHSVPDKEIQRIPDYNKTGETSSFYKGVCRLNKSCLSQMNSIEFQKIISFCKKVDEIIVIGHGLGFADKEYYEELYHANQDAKWIYYGKSETEKDSYDRKIKDMFIPMEIRYISELATNNINHV